MINRVRAISEHVSRARSSLIRASDYHGVSINTRETRIYVTFQDNEGESVRASIVTVHTVAYPWNDFRQST